MKIVTVVVGSKNCCCTSKKKEHVNYILMLLLLSIIIFNWSYLRLSLVYRCWMINVIIRMECRLVLLNKQETEVMKTNTSKMFKTLVICTCCSFYALNFYRAKWLTHNAMNKWAGCESIISHSCIRENKYFRSVIALLGRNSKECLNKQLITSKEKCLHI